MGIVTISAEVNVMFWDGRREVSDDVVVASFIRLAVVVIVQSLFVTLVFSVVVCDC